MNQQQLNEVMFMAVRTGQLGLLKKAVEKGADIHAYEDEALRYASCYGHLEMVKYLVEQGADIHATNDCALSHAAFYGHIEVAAYLKSLE